MLNKTIIQGRLVRDVELRQTVAGTPVASFTVAVDGFGRDQNNNPVNQASFINCVAWNTQAKFISTYCKKGTLVALEGRLQTRSYDRKDGTKAYVTEVIADRVENLKNRKFDIVVSRAVADMSKISQYALPLVKNNGYFIAYKSKKAIEEIEEAKSIIKKFNGEIVDIIQYTLPLEEVFERNLICIKKIGK